MKIYHIDVTSERELYDRLFTAYPIDTQLVLSFLNNERNIPALVYLTRLLLTTRQQKTKLTAMQELNLLGVEQIIGLNRGCRRISEEHPETLNAIKDLDPFMIDFLYIIRTNTFVTLQDFEQALAASPVLQYMEQFNNSRMAQSIMALDKSGTTNGPLDLHDLEAQGPDKFSDTVTVNTQDEFHQLKSHLHTIHYHRNALLGIAIKQVLQSHKDSLELWVFAGSITRYSPTLLKALDDAGNAGDSPAPMQGVFGSAGGEGVSIASRTHTAPLGGEEQHPGVVYIEQHADRICVLNRKEMRSYSSLHHHSGRQEKQQRPSSQPQGPSASGQQPSGAPQDMYGGGAGYSTDGSDADDYEDGELDHSDAAAFQSILGQHAFTEQASFERSMVVQQRSKAKQAIEAYERQRYLTMLSEQNDDADGADGVQTRVGGGRQRPAGRTTSSSPSSTNTSEEGGNSARAEMPSTRHTLTPSRFSENYRGLLLPYYTIVEMTYDFELLDLLLAWSKRVWHIDDNMQALVGLGVFPAAYCARLQQGSGVYWRYLRCEDDVNDTVTGVQAELTLANLATATAQKSQTPRDILPDRHRGVYPYHSTSDSIRCLTSPACGGRYHLDTPFDAVMNAVTCDESDAIPPQARVNSIGEVHLHDFKLDASTPFNTEDERQKLRMIEDEFTKATAKPQYYEGTGPVSLIFAAETPDKHHMDNTSCTSYVSEADICRVSEMNRNATHHETGQQTAVGQLANSLIEDPRLAHPQPGWSHAQAPPDGTTTHPRHQHTSRPVSHVSLVRSILVQDWIVTCPFIANTHEILLPWILYCKLLQKKRLLSIYTGSVQFSEREFSKHTNRHPAKAPTSEQCGDGDDGMLEQMHVSHYYLSTHSALYGFIIQQIHKEIIQLEACLDVLFYHISPEAWMDQDFDYLLHGLYLCAKFSLDYTMVRFLEKHGIHEETTPGIARLELQFHNERRQKHSAHAKTTGSHTENNHIGAGSTDLESTPASNYEFTVKMKPHHAYDRDIYLALLICLVRHELFETATQVIQSFTYHRNHYFSYLYSNHRRRMVPALVMTCPSIFALQYLFDHNVFHAPIIANTDFGEEFCIWLNLLSIRMTIRDDQLTNSLLTTVFCQMERFYLSALSTHESFKNTFLDVIFQRRALAPYLEELVVTVPVAPSPSPSSPCEQTTPGSAAAYNHQSFYTNQFHPKHLAANTQHDDQRGENDDDNDDDDDIFADYQIQDGYTSVESGVAGNTVGRASSSQAYPHDASLDGYDTPHIDSQQPLPFTTATYPVLDIVDLTLLETDKEIANAVRTGNHNTIHASTVALNNIGIINVDDLNVLVANFRESSEKLRQAHGNIITHHLVELKLVHPGEGPDHTSNAPLLYCFNSISLPLLGNLVPSSHNLSNAFQRFVEHNNHGLRPHVPVHLLLRYLAKRFNPAFFNHNLFHYCIKHYLTANDRAALNISGSILAEVFNSFESSYRKSISVLSSYYLPQQSISHHHSPSTSLKYDLSIYHSPHLYGSIGNIQHPVPNYGIASHGDEQTPPYNLPLRGGAARDHEPSQNAFIRSAHFLMCRIRNAYIQAISIILQTPSRHILLQSEPLVKSITRLSYILEHPQFMKLITSHNRSLLKSLGQHPQRSQHKEAKLEQDAQFLQQVEEYKKLPKSLFGKHRFDFMGLTNIPFAEDNRKTPSADLDVPDALTFIHTTHGGSQDIPAFLSEKLTNLDAIRPKTEGEPIPINSDVEYNRSGTLDFYREFLESELSEHEYNPSLFQEILYGLAQLTPVVFHRFDPRRLRSPLLFMNLKQTSPQPKAARSRTQGRVFYLWLHSVYDYELKLVPKIQSAALQAHPADFPSDVGPIELRGWQNTIDACSMCLTYSDDQIYGNTSMLAVPKPPCSLVLDEDASTDEHSIHVPVGPHDLKLRQKLFLHLQALPAHKSHETVHDDTHELPTLQLDAAELELTYGEMVDRLLAQVKHSKHADVPLTMYFQRMPQDNPALEWLRQVLICYPRIDQSHMAAWLITSLETGDFITYRTLSLLSGISRHSLYDELSLLSTVKSIENAQKVYGYHLLYSYLLAEILRHPHIDFHNVTMATSFYQLKSIVRERVKSMQNRSILPSIQASSSQRTSSRNLRPKKDPAGLEAQEATRGSSKVGLQPAAIPTSTTPQMQVTIEMRDPMLITSPLMETIRKLLGIAPSHTLTRQLLRVSTNLNKTMLFAEMIQNHVNNLIIDFIPITQQISIEEGSFDGLILSLMYRFFFLEAEIDQYFVQEVRRIHYEIVAIYRDHLPWFTQLARVQNAQLKHHLAQHNIDSTIHGSSDVEGTSDASVISQTITTHHVAMRLPSQQSLAGILSQLELLPVVDTLTGFCPSGARGRPVSTESSPLARMTDVFVYDGQFSLFRTPSIRIPTLDLSALLVCSSFTYGLVDHHLVQLTSYFLHNGGDLMAVFNPPALLMQEVRRIRTTEAKQAQQKRQEEQEQRHREGVTNAMPQPSPFYKWKIPLTPAARVPSINGRFSTVYERLMSCMGSTGHLLLASIFTYYYLFYHHLTHRSTIQARLAALNKLISYQDTIFPYAALAHPREENPLYAKYTGIDHDFQTHLELGTIISSAPPLSQDRVLQLQADVRQYHQQQLEDFQQLHGRSRKPPSSLQLRYPKVIGLAVVLPSSPYFDNFCDGSDVDSQLKHMDEVLIKLHRSSLVNDVVNKAWLTPTINEMMIRVRQRHHPSRTTLGFSSSFLHYHLKQCLVSDRSTLAHHFCGSVHDLHAILSTTTALHINPSQKDGFQETPLMVTAALNRFDLFRTLLLAGGWADITTRDRFGQTILMYLTSADNTLFLGDYVQRKRYGVISRDIFTEHGVYNPVITETRQKSGIVTTEAERVRQNWLRLHRASSSPIIYLARELLQEEESKDSWFANDNHLILRHALTYISLCFKFGLFSPSSLEVFRSNWLYHFMPGLESHSDDDDDDDDDDHDDDHDDDVIDRRS